MIEFFKEKNNLFVKIRSDFIYPSVKRMESIISLDEIESITIDMSSSKIVDSEGVKLIYNLVADNISVTLINPPSIYHKIVEILKLKDLLKNVKVVKEECR